MINPSKYLIEKPTLARQFVTKLNKSGALLPVILLEATVTGGRTYQAYKRDGFVEARERLTEESLAAIFWLFGAKMFGALFDKIGQKFFKIPKTMPSVGRDSLRTPFDNYINKLSGILKISPENAANLKKRLAGYSVGKTAASLITACLFVGCVVPKLNQAITKLLYKKMDLADSDHKKIPDFRKDKITIKDARTLFSAKDISINAVENFKAQKSANSSKTPDKAQNTPSFKASADSLLRIVQNFEENDIWKLLGTDVGILSGRTTNARNNDERVEIAFRDTTSIYFYCFSMPAIIAFMNRKDVFKGLNTKLNPMSAMEVHNHLIQKMAEKGFESTVKADVFKDFALGKELDKDLMSKFFEPRENVVTKKQFFGLFKKQVELEPRFMKLSEFEAKVDAFAPEADKARLKELGRKMASLMQPAKYFGAERATAKVITETQVEDILRGGIIREPEFLSKTLNGIFKTKSDKTPISNPHKYIPSSDIENRKKQIFGYVQSIIDDAQKRGGDVKAERMLELNKRNMRKNGLFMLLAMSVSSLFLSTLIPKAQYYITYLRTGTHAFPGTEELDKQTKKSQK